MSRLNYRERERRLNKVEMYRGIPRSDLVEDIIGTRELVSAIDNRSIIRGTYLIHRVTAVVAFDHRPARDMMK
jgi:hypothetical protein